MPFAAKSLPELQDLVLFLKLPLVALHVRVDHVDPPFTALARFPMASVTHSLVELLRNPGPLLGLGTRLSALGLGGDFLSDALEYLGLTGGPSRLLALDVLDEQPALLALE